MKRKLTATIIFLMCLSLPVAQGSAAKGREEEQTNIVLVMDKSNSMTNTDPRNYSKFAANMVISAFDDYDIPLIASKDRLSGVRVGVLAYGAETETVCALEPVSRLDFGEVRKKINEIDYTDGSAMSGTNFFKGMEAAVQMCGGSSGSRNIILIMSDGQIDLNGAAEGGEMPEEDKKKYLGDFSKVTGSENYTVYTIGIDTSGSQGSFSDLKKLTTPDGEHATVKANSKELLELFKNFTEKLFGKGDETESRIDGKKCSFTLDKRYKSVQVFIAVNDNNDGKALKAETIKTAHSGGDVAFSEGMKIKNGALSGSSTVTVSENSGMAIGVHIDNACKGEWTITLNENADIVSVYPYNPFPWHIALLGIIIALLLLLIIMWLLYIPPVRYRKKGIPGKITVEKNAEGIQTTLHDGRFIMELMREGKFLNRGNLTVGTLLNDKRYSGLVIKYSRAKSEFDDDSLKITDGKSSVRSYSVFAQTGTIIPLDSGDITVYWEY